MVSVLEIKLIPDATQNQTSNRRPLTEFELLIKDYTEDSKYLPSTIYKIITNLTNIKQNNYQEKWQKYIQKNF